MEKHTQGELTIVPARYSRKTDILAFDICANITHNEITNICSILPKELCDNSYSGHLPNTNVSVEEAKANAERLVLCWNNFDAMYNFIKEMATKYEKSEWIAGEANRILNNINQL